MLEELIAFSPDEGGAVVAAGGEAPAVGAQESPGGDPAQEAPVGEASIPEAMAPPVPGLQMEEASAPGAKPQQAVQPTTDPGIEQLKQQMAWFQQQYQGVLDANEKLRVQLSDYQMAELSDEERAQALLQQREQQVQEQLAQLEEARYKSDLYNYYSGFVPNSVMTGANPAEWQHSVLSYLHGTVQKLWKENQMLRKSVRPGEAAPKVSSPGGGSSPVQSDLYSMTREEREKLYAKAKAGLYTPGQ